MKTETKIAEENISDREESGDMAYVGLCKEHKASCERDVPKLKKIKESIVYVENELVHHLLDELIEDKENAIKLYNEAGI